MSEWFDIQELGGRTWALVEPHQDSVTSYLLEGSESALLIDTGLGIGNMRQAVEALTDRPILVVNTHSHYDHIGGNRLFANTAAHPADIPAIERGIPAEQLVHIADTEAFLAPPPKGFSASGFSVPPSSVGRQLADGDILGLGDRLLQVVHTPGHSPGSICLWEPAASRVFVGDLLYFGNLFACLPGSDFAAYRRSLQRLSEVAEAASGFYPGHGPFPIQPSFAERLAVWFEDVAFGNVSYHTATSAWGRVRVYQGGRFNLILPDDPPG